MTVHVSDDLGADGAAALVRALAEVGPRLCLSGGSSPDAVLSKLPGAVPSTLARALRLTWSDERAIPYSGHWESWDLLVNRRSAHERWLRHLDHGVLEVPPYDGSGDAESARARFESRFADELGGLDVWLLGFGPDGHVASLFPGHGALDAVSVAAVVADAPKPPAIRVTLTLPTLGSVGRAIGLCAGAEKGRVLARALAGDVGLPLGRYVSRPVEWIVDRAAAAAMEAA